jgi:excisionase family DNA binding protein
MQFDVPGDDVGRPLRAALHRDPAAVRPGYWTHDPELPIDEHRFIRGVTSSGWIVHGPDLDSGQEARLVFAHRRASPCPWPWPPPHPLRSHARLPNPSNATFRTNATDGWNRNHDQDWACPVPTDLLTTGQLAKAIGVTPQSVARWVRDGWITPAEVTAGGHYRFRLDDVRAQLRERRRTSE